MLKVKTDYRDSIDMFVGNVIRNTRKEMSISLKKLASEIGLTQQQVQKYEKGDNRISASKLFLIAKALGKEVEFFFPNQSDYKLHKEARATKLSDSVTGEYQAEKQEDLLRLMKAFSSINNDDVQEQIIKLVESFSKYHNSCNK